MEKLANERIVASDIAAEIFILRPFEPFLAKKYFF
jgi:hypothetical protein